MILFLILYFLVGIFVSSFLALNVFEKCGIITFIALCIFWPLVLLDLLG
jgi:hypothetical protein